MMQDNDTSKGKHLTEPECQLIERWHNKEKLSNQETTYRLGRSPQTIHNKIQRGAVQLDEQISKAVKNKISLEVIHQEIKSAFCLPTHYDWIAKGLLYVAYHDLFYPQYIKPKKQHRHNLNTYQVYLLKELMYFQNMVMFV